MSDQDEHEPGSTPICATVPPTFKFTVGDGVPGPFTVQAGTVEVTGSGVPIAVTAYAVGIPDGFVAYMIPTPEPQPSPYPWRPAPASGDFYFPPTPDPGISINADVAKLIALGLKNIDALRLLMLCDWSLARAEAVASLAISAGEDPVKFARQHLRDR